MKFVEPPDDVLSAACDVYEELQKLGAIPEDTTDDAPAVYVIAFAILAERKRIDWKSIETPPRDGVRVLVCYGGTEVECAEFVNGAWIDPYCDPLPEKPTHWVEITLPVSEEAGSIE